MKEDRLTRRGFVSKLVKWGQHALLAVVPISLFGRGKVPHFEEVTLEKTNTSDMLAKKSCSCTCEKQTLKSAASTGLQSGPGTGCGCQCGSGPKNSAWQTAAQSAHRDIK